MDTLPSEHKAKRMIWENCEEAVAAKDPHGNGSFPTQFQDDLSKRRSSDPKQKSTLPTTFNLSMPYMMPLLSIPNMEEYSSRASTVLTGTAKKGGTGPSVGAVDIGVSKSAYFFRVALPGVKQDPGTLFSGQLNFFVSAIFFNIRYAFILALPLAKHWELLAVDGIRGTSLE